MPTFDSDVIIGAHENCVDIEKEKARMLSDNLTAEARSHIQEAFASRRDNPEQAIKNARIVTKQTGEDLANELKQLAISKGLLRPEDLAPGCS